MTRALLALLIGLAGLAAAAPPAERAELKPESVEGCSGIPYARAPRQLWIAGDQAVDVAADFWVLDRPARFFAGRALERFRVGKGALLVEAQLDSDLDSEVVRIWEEGPIDSDVRGVYLPGVALPCERRTHYRVTRLPPAPGDLEPLARFGQLLHEAFELQYDAAFAAARERLEQARALRPDDPTPYWLMARLLYLEIEQDAARIPPEQRVQRFQEVERWADQAVARGPAQAEGYLWQGVARGRIATSMGNLRVALAGAVGGRGPAWLERTLRRAVELPDRFRFFGFGTRGDALYALAQFYRLAPDGWYMRLVGTQGDRDRAVQLAREAAKLQPVRIEYRKELAVALLCRDARGDRQEAQRELAALLQLPAITPLDRIDQMHARALQARTLPNVCAYSRDSFVEAGP